MEFNLNNKPKTESNVPKKDSDKTLVNLLNKVQLPNIYVNVLLVVLSCAILITLGYYSGYQKGLEKANTKNSKINSALEPIRENLERNRNYWSIVGTVESVDSTSITVKNNKGKIETAIFDENPSINNQQNKTDNKKEYIQVGQNVIVTGEKTDTQPLAKDITIKR